MIDIKRYDGAEELSKLLKTFAVIPSNTEIVERTGVSKGSVSEIMNGKRTPTKKFIDKFKKGFNILDENVPETKKTADTGSFELIALREKNEALLKEIAFYRELLLKK